jgi:putative Holliday junction resolvase
MAVCNITEIKEFLSPGSRLLGLDVGETLRRGKFAKDAVGLSEIVEREGIGGLVIGLPVSMDGSEGPRAQSVRQFAANLLERFDIAIAFWDERLSTAAVTRTLLEADASRKRRREVVDKMAAAYILQGALDRLANA